MSSSKGLIAALAVMSTFAALTGPASADLNIGRSVSQTIEPRSEFGPQPDNAYLVPRFKVLVGNAEVVNSLPASVISRFFSAIERPRGQTHLRIRRARARSCVDQPSNHQSGKETKAVAITAKVDNGPEFPLLIVTHDGNTYSQDLAVSRALPPAMAFPGGARPFVISMKSSTTFNSVLASNILSAASAASAVIGGIPAAVLSPTAKSAGATLDQLISSTFTTSVNFRFSNDLTYDDVKNIAAITLAFFDGDASKNAPVIAQVRLELPIKTSIVGTRHEKTGKFMNPEPNTMLAAPLKDRTFWDLLHQGEIGTFMGQLKATTSLPAYSIGCGQIRNAIAGWGLNEADNRAIFYSAISTLKPLPQGFDCPTEQERSQMASTYGLLPPLVSGSPWDAYRDLMEGSMQNILRASASVAPIMGKSLRFVQTSAAFKDIAVGETGKQMSVADIDALFKANPVTEFKSFQYLGDGTAFVGSLVVNGTKYQATVTFQRVLNEQGAPVIQIVAMKVFSPISV
jgi:hypothetical protein